MQAQFRINLSSESGGKLGVEVSLEREGRSLTLAQSPDVMSKRPGVFLSLRDNLIGMALPAGDSGGAPAMYRTSVSCEHFVAGRYEVHCELYAPGESSAEPVVASSEPAVFYRGEKNGRPVVVPMDNRFRVAAGGFLRLKKGLGASHLWTNYDFSAVIRPDKTDPVQYPDVRLYPHGRFTSEEAPLPGRSRESIARYEGGECFKIIEVVYEAAKVDKDGAAYQCLRVLDQQGREGYLWSVYGGVKYVEDASEEDFQLKSDSSEPEPAPAEIKDSKVLVVSQGDFLRLVEGLGSSRLWKGYDFDATRRMDAVVDFALYPHGRWDNRVAPLPKRGSGYGAIKRYDAGASFEVLYVAFEAVMAGTDHKAYQCLYVRSAEGLEGYLWSVYGGVVYVEASISQAPPRASTVKSAVLTLMPGETYRLKTGMGSSGLWSEYDFNKTARSEADGEHAYPDEKTYPYGRWTAEDGAAPLPRPARSRSVVTRYQGGERFRLKHIAYEAVTAARDSAAYQCIMIEDEEGREGYLWSVYAGDVYVEPVGQGDAAAPPRARSANSFLKEAQTRIFTAVELAREKVAQQPADQVWEAIRAAQKALYRKGLLVHHGYGAARSEDATPFVWNDDDWRNLWQLEAIVEFYMNFNDPNRTGPLIEGENKPRDPGHPDYIALDLSRSPEKSRRNPKPPFAGCHLVVVDSLGGRVGGAKAMPGDDRKSLLVEGGDLLERTNAGWDTVYVHPNASTPENRVFKILARDGARLELDRPVPHAFGEGPFEWNIPAGLGARTAPPLDYTLRKTTNGYDHYDGVVFIVKDGIVHFRERVSSFTSRTHVSHAANGRDMSLRGNNMYYFQSDPAGGNRTINYAFTVTAESGYAWTRRDARSYFADPVKEGVTWNLFLHYGYYDSNRTGSAGCLTSPAFSSIRDKIIELYQKEYVAEFGVGDAAAAKLQGLEQSEAKEVFSEDLAAENTWWWSMKVWGNLWLVRPEELPPG